MTDIITNPEPTAPMQNPESGIASAPATPAAPPPAPDQIQTLEGSAPEAVHAEEAIKSKYARLAEEYRSLGQKQISGTLDQNEIVRKKEFDEMAAYGLFTEQAESQLRAKEGIYLEHTEAAKKEFSDLPALSSELRSLRQKLYNSSLSAAEFARVKYLEVVERMGKFQDVGAVA